MPEIPEGYYPVYHACGAVALYSKNPPQQDHELEPDEVVWLDGTRAKKGDTVPNPLCQHCGYGLTNGATFVGFEGTPKPSKQKAKK